MSAGWRLAELAADTFAVAMMLVMFSSFAVIGLLVWSMKRHVSRRDRHADALLEELLEVPQESVAGNRDRKSPQNRPSHGSGTTTGGNDPDFKDLLRQSIHAWRGYERNSPCRSFGHAVGKMGPPLVTTLPGTLFPLALLIESEFFVDHEGAEGQQGGDECLHRATESDFSVEQGEQEAEA